MARIVVPKPITIDFETKAIDDRPRYPPEPVGVSIGYPGRKARYYAWGHPVNNNCDKRAGVQALREAYTAHLKGAHLLHHNGKFDIDVAQTHMDVGDIALDPLRCHDTQFLLFLLDPHSFSLALKPSAEKFLGIPPDEQDAVRDWLIEHQKQLKVDGLLPQHVRITAVNFGAYICLAPGDLVGRYAVGDIVRTHKLFVHLYPLMIEANMQAAYQREQRLVPILLANERQGMRCDLAGLERDLPMYEAAMGKAEQWLRKRLKAPDLDFNKDRELADALDKAGIVTEWTLTATGLKSVNKKNLKPSHYKDPKVFQVLGYRNKLETCVSTYYKPWLRTASATGGILHAGWNQTRNDKDAGTRTGRLSSSPNFMAVAKSFEDKGDGWTHPDFIDLPHLPLMRKYLLPDARNHVWGRRDYNQQELRILGHFEDGELMHAYRANPRLDVHAFVQQAIKELLGIELPRTPVKTLNFGLIYGQGIASMAEKLNRSVDEVQKARQAQFAALPGLKELDNLIKQRGKTGQPITTWGGRVYYAEEPKVIDGRLRTFEYKLLNYLIQGSAADCTKEALVRYHDAGYGDARFVVTVHDEINISAPKGAFKREMLRLRDIMMSVEFDVPMMSDAEYGPNWAEMTTLKEPAPDLSRWGV
jgi:DNA polymerase I-like protein with 3'-5' exonuclease and polymerase domains